MERERTLTDATDLMLLGVTRQAVEEFIELDQREPAAARAFWRSLLGQDADLSVPDRVGLVMADGELLRRAMQLTDGMPEGFDAAIESWYYGDISVARPVLLRFQKLSPERAGRTFAVVVQQVSLATVGDIVEERGWTFDDAVAECARLCGLLGAGTIADAVGFPAIERAAHRLDTELVAGQGITERTRELLAWAEKADPQRLAVVWGSLLTVTYLARADLDVEVPVLEHPRRLPEVVDWVQEQTLDERLAKLASWFDARRLDDLVCMR